MSASTTFFRPPERSGRARLWRSVRRRKTMKTPAESRLAAGIMSMMSGQSAPKSPQDSIRSKRMAPRMASMVFAIAIRLKCQRRYVKGCKNRRAMAGRSHSCWMFPRSVPLSLKPKNRYSPVPAASQDDSVRTSIAAGASATCPFGHETPTLSRRKPLDVLSEALDLSREIGVTGFEPAAFASRTQRSTKLSYTPESRGRASGAT